MSTHAFELLTRFGANEQHILQLIEVQKLVSIDISERMLKIMAINPKLENYFRDKLDTIILSAIILPKVEFKIPKSDFVSFDLKQEHFVFYLNNMFADYSKIALIAEKDAHLSFTFCLRKE